MQKIEINLTTNPKLKTKDEQKLGFGKYYTDHMFLMNYDSGKGWHNPRIVPYANISLDPAAVCLHYGQEVFEGLKAYKTKQNKILLFRPEKNMQRLNVSNERLCIPQIDEQFCVDAIKKLISIERDWVPSSQGASLYVRPFIFGTDPQIGLRPAEHFLFVIICSPVSTYYADGLKPVKIYVEQNYVRAVSGGVGFAKTAANYAASLKAQSEAINLGYSQVLWLDGIERKYIDEVGMMNVFFVIGNEVITPALQGSILPGITRMSAISLLESWGLKAVQRRLSINEVYQAHKSGHLKEAFGTGTAAAVSPIGELNWNGNIIKINNEETGPIAKKLYDSLIGIQQGQIKDEMGWTVTVD